MAFCGYCGTQIQDGVKFCPSCGKEVGTVGASPQQDYKQPAAPPGDAEANKGMAILAYILFFVPLLTGAHNTSPFVKYHTNQGTALFIAALLYAVVYNVLSRILVFIPILGWLLMAILPIIPVAFLVIGIINAANGSMKPLPFIGGFDIIK
ncbi:MAG: zinc-ribbon domain-containing protein [Clostridiales bacterium]|jgi:uncharacterized membrane protein|nr:zinc-ribbon domain-containing protein [Clostridiales bacterium]